MAARGDVRVRAKDLSGMSEYGGKKIRLMETCQCLFFLNPLALHDRPCRYRVLVLVVEEFSYAQAYTQGVIYICMRVCVHGA